MQILHTAAIGSESDTKSAIEILLDQNITPTIERIKDLLDSKHKQEVVVHVREPIVSQYDLLLQLTA